MSSSNRIQWGLASICLSLTLTAQAMPISEVIFVNGSSCGNYQGDLTAGRLFEVEMESAQQLIISTDGHVQSVIGSKGEELQDKGGANYRYQSMNPGTHTIKMVGRAQSGIEFCVN